MSHPLCTTEGCSLGDCPVCREFARMRDALESIAHGPTNGETHRRFTRRAMAEARAALVTDADFAEMERFLMTVVARGGAA